MHWSNFEPVSRKAFNANCRGTHVSTRETLGTLFAFACLFEVHSSQYPWGTLDSTDRKADRVPVPAADVVVGGSHYRAPSCEFDGRGEVYCLRRRAFRRAYGYIQPDEGHFCSAHHPSGGTSFRLSPPHRFCP